MEPIMMMEVVVEERLASAILNDLSRRRANILYISQRHDVRVRDYLHFPSLSQSILKHFFTSI